MLDPRVSMPSPQGTGWMRYKSERQRACDGTFGWSSARCTAESASEVSPKPCLSPSGAKASASRAGETLSAWSRSGTVSTPVRAFFSGGGGACDASVARYSRHVSTRASIFGAPGVSHSLVSSAPASRAASKHVCHARECHST